MGVSTALSLSTAFIRCEGRSDLGENLPSYLIALQVLLVISDNLEQLFSSLSHRQVKHLLEYVIAERITEELDQLRVVFNTFEQLVSCLRITSFDTSLNNIRAELVF